MIKVSANKKIISLYIILNIAGYNDDNDLPSHPMRDKIRNDFADIDIRRLKKYKTAINKYHIYWLVFLAIHTDDSWELTEYGKRNTCDHTLGNVGYTILETIKWLKLEDYYYNCLYEEYNELCSKLDNDLRDISIRETLENYWELKIDNVQYVIVPNPFDACFRGYGFRIDNSIISISGPGYNRKTKKS